MIENVQIVNKNGDGMFTEGIAYIEILTSGKKFLFYTLNERVDNDLTKIYIAESTEKAGEANPISPEEWDDLRKKMVKISHKETLEDVKFLNMKDVTFNVGEPKKLAVTAVAKQAFKDAQISNTMSTDQSSESAMPGGTSFFNNNVVETPTEPTENALPDSASIFSNPPQPVDAPMGGQPIIAPEINIAGITPVDVTPIQPVEVTPIQPAVEVAPAAPVAPVVETPAVEAAPAAPVVEAPVVEVAPAAPVAPVVETTPVVEQPTPGIISDEEALKAISIIQEYIDQETNK